GGPAGPAAPRTQPRLHRRPLPPPPLPCSSLRPAGQPGPSAAELRRRHPGSSWDSTASDIRYISDGVECSPPPSPTPLPPGTKAVPGSYTDPFGGSGGSYNSRKEAEAMLPSGDPLGSLERRAGTGQTYSERVEEYHQRYAYMKSWAGLLRILGVAELLLGAAVFACVTAYVHKDNEWYNMFGYSQPYGYGAGIIFLFVTVIMYLISAVVCLKLWRHEGARRHRELMEQEYENDDRQREEVSYRQLKSLERKPELLNGHIPAGHIPKPIVMPDYLAKYPVIQTNEMRDRYKAVFNDQFAEYKELSAEVHAVLKKFNELDALLKQLPHHPESIYEQERISKVLQEYKKKKNSAFLEKKERCEYLKNKLSHIKQRIQDYDKVMNWNIET
uniref:MARVEL domain containing 2 n=1 Tax=Malurus cyaneus samueli TaxID=2593467 RepID=A0A8C5UN55_9PASS